MCKTHRTLDRPSDGISRQYLEDFVICDADSPKLPGLVTVFTKFPIAEVILLRPGYKLTGHLLFLTHELSVGVVFLARIISK